MLVLKAPQSEVLGALRRVADVAPTRSTLPILSNVRIAKVGETLSLTGTDLDVEATFSVALGGDDGSFSTTVSAKRIVDVLQTAAADQVVSITEKAGKLIVQAGKSRFNLNTMPAADYPCMKSGEAVARITVTQKSLRDLLGKVAFAMAVHNIRYFLLGVLLEIDEDGITAVATDGSHLAKASTGTGGVKSSVILPRASVLYLQKMLADVDDPVTIDLADRLASFEFGTLRFLTKLVDGRFPDYRRVIPRQLEQAVTLGRAPLLHALRAVSVVNTTKFHGVRVLFEPGLLKLSTDVSGENAVSELEIDYGGPSVELGFDAKLLAEGLDAIDADMLRVEFSDDKAPLLMTVPGAISPTGTS